MKKVKATREGLIGGITASGYKIDKVVPFVALPDTKALFRFVRIKANDKQVIAIVLDVGPWNEHDSDYVFGPNQPAAESGIDTRGRITNKAGIDLSEKIWKQLDMKDNGPVEWEFIE
uniref:Uncharacterized protein n=1 Tax=viral metagenome TaxID=1070528 RepID=A0A6M3LEX2_9ZZZZ